MSDQPTTPHHLDGDPSTHFVKVIDGVTSDCIAAIAHSASSNSIEAFLVGGMLRDIFAGLAPVSTSPDIVVIGDAASFARMLATQHRDAELISVSQFDTAKVQFGAATVDIASARTDKYDPSGSLPQITPVNEIRRDLARRDYTVNAMAVPIHPSGFGELIDPFNGRKDAASRKLRVLHHDAFAEDPLRMLRGARIAARYGYSFVQSTEKLFTASIEALTHMLERSPQRVFNEFQHWFDAHENLCEIIAIAQRLGLLQAIGIASSDIDIRRLQIVDQSASELGRFAAFMYCLPDETANLLGKTMQMPSEWSSVVDQISTARGIAKRCANQDIGDVELRDSLITLHDDVLQSVIAVEQEPAVSDRFRGFCDRLKHLQPTLNGNDLIRLGVEPGPLVGQLLRELLIRHIYGTVSSVEDEQFYIRQRLDELRRH